MVIAAFICFTLLIIGWFVAPASGKLQTAEVVAQPTDLKATVTP